mmetsp:Transcript_41530/g.119126  ORF Transcript_41530/g.119126 Transcript_41530/m.119126 type:complete len:291 (+) Transcript_41530:210-1082(+)
MWWNSIDMVTASKASSVPRAQRRPDWSLHYQCAERPASTGSLLVPRLREARGGAARSGAALGHPAGTEASEDFWQKMEDSELKLTKASWRREQFLHKDLVVQVDPLHDSSLYDLKLHHNSAQRAKTLSLPTPPSSAPSVSGRASSRSASRFGSSRQSCVSSRSRESAKDISRGAPQRLRDLRVAFERRQCHTANAFGISMRHINDTQLLGVVDRLHVLAGDVGAAPGPGGGEYLPAGRQMTVGATQRSKATLRPKRERSRSTVFKENLKEMLWKVRDPSSTPVVPFGARG